MLRYRQCICNLLEIIFVRQDCSLTQYTEEEIDTAVGLLWTNSFACASGGGQALFPVFSLISHSCISNCTHSVFPNKHLALQSRMKIKKGQELTINYISSTQVSSILPMDYISIDDFIQAPGSNLQKLNYGIFRESKEGERN